MNKKTTLSWMFVSAIILLSLACSVVGSTKPEAPESAPLVSEEAPLQAEEPVDAAPVQPEEPLVGEAEAPAAPATYDTNFPLPPDVQNFVKMGDKVVNYQTNLSLEQCMDFYRAELKSRGLKERDLLTVFNATTFSMVFDGDPKGAIVIQGVDLGNGVSNVSIRYEDV